MMCCVEATNETFVIRFVRAFATTRCCRKKHEKKVASVKYSHSRSEGPLSDRGLYETLSQKMREKLNSNEPELAKLPEVPRALETLTNPHAHEVQEIVIDRDNAPKIYGVHQAPSPVPA